MTRWLRLSGCLMVLGLLALCLPGALAAWGPISIQQAVEESNLIVVATLIQVDLHVDADGHAVSGEGKLEVERVLFNPGGLEGPLKLAWTDGVYRSCPRHDHALKIGFRCVWLLKAESDGVVRADHPSRVIRLVEPWSFENTLEALRSSGASAAPDSPQARLLTFLEEEARKKEVGRAR